MLTIKRKKVLKPKNSGLKRKFTAFRVLIFTRHPSHSRLRRELPLLPFRSVIRLGSTTPSRLNRVECNSIQGVKNSSSKLLMKQCFSAVGVKTAAWLSGINNTKTTILDWSNNKYPIVAKSLYGSRGVGNFKLDTQGALEEWMKGKELSHYIFEQFISMSREYRLHVTQQGCFYACRKLLRNDAPDGTWQRHDDVCSWVLETNQSFKKPNNWNLIIADCIKAQKSLGLDICAFDVMVQGSQDGRERTNPEWNICESCSAPSLAEVGIEKYKIEIPKVLRFKHGN